MQKQKDVGVYQLANGNWAFRYGVVVNGKTHWKKYSKDECGNELKTKNSAIRARRISLSKAQLEIEDEGKDKVHKTVAEVFQEYCEKGRSGKAYATIKKQDSLWKNHLKKRFGKKYIDEITVAEVNDYLEELYYLEDRAYTYVESFLKMFYLIFGQAYSRNYLSAEEYDKLCKNKDTKIHMPKLKIDEDLDIVFFNDKTMSELDKYFKDTNAETAYMLGKYCGLRINECYGLKWSNVDLKKGIITIDRQMQYQEGLIKLVSLKTRNARRKVYMCKKLKAYLKKQYKQMEQDKQDLALQRQQNQTFIQDINGEYISSLELVNSLSNGKIQTVNSMKYHSRTLQGEYKIEFRYHYLRHTYGTKLALMNTPMHVLCNQMGHASSNVTQRYYLGMSEQGVDELVSNLDRI